MSTQHAQPSITLERRSAPGAQRPDDGDRAVRREAGPGDPVASADNHRTEPAPDERSGPNGRPTDGPNSAPDAGRDHAPDHRSEVTGRPAGYREVFGVREFRAVFAADLLSLVGDQMAAVAVAVMLFQHSGSPLLAAAGYATAYLPWLIGGPVLAAWAERFTGRSVMVTCDLLRAVLIGAAALPGVPPLAVAGLVFLAALHAPPFDAARSALLTHILTGNRYPVGMSLRQAVHQAAQLTGFALGGTLVLVLSAPGVLALNCLTFLVSAAVLRFFLIARPGPQQTTPARQTAARQTDSRPTSADPDPGSNPGSDPDYASDRASDPAATAAQTDDQTAQDDRETATDPDRVPDCPDCPDRQDRHFVPAQSRSGARPGPGRVPGPRAQDSGSDQERADRSRELPVGQNRSADSAQSPEPTEAAQSPESSEPTESEPPGRSSVWHDLLAGARVVSGDERIWFPLLLGIIGAAYAIVPEAVAVAYAAELGHGSRSVGLIMAAAAAGSVIGGLAIGRLAGPDLASRLMCPLALAGTVPLLLVALRPGLVVSLSLFAVCGLGQAFQVVANTQFATNVPAPMRTRAFGLAVAGLYAGQSLAILVAGAAAQWLAPSTVIAGSGLVGAAGVLLLKFRPAIR